MWLRKAWRLACFRVMTLVVASVSLLLASPPSRVAIADESSPGHTALFFAGLDLWRGGNYEHGGVYWSPNGLDREGFTFKTLLSGGAYRYTSGALGGERVDGRQLGAQILPGWRFVRDAVEVKVFAGVEWLNHRLFPDDASASLRGRHIAARGTVEAWYAPDPNWMLTGHASIASLGTMHDARIAGGWRLFDLFYAGPELVTFSAFNYRQYRAGLHITSLRTGEWEWSGALGYARDSDRVSGPYARIGVLTRR